MRGLHTTSVPALMPETHPQYSEALGCREGETERKRERRRENGRQKEREKTTMTE